MSTAGENETIRKRRDTRDKENNKVATEKSEVESETHERDVKKVGGGGDGRSVEQEEVKKGGG